MKTITNFYNQFTVSEAMVKAWHSVLVDYEIEMVMMNLKNHVVNSKFPPTVADLVKQETYKSSAYVQIGQDTLERKRDEAKRLVEQYEKTGYLDI
jgi:hypothetical protein